MNNQIPQNPIKKVRRFKHDVVASEDSDDSEDNLGTDGTKLDSNYRNIEAHPPQQIESKDKERQKKTREKRDSLASEASHSGELGQVLPPQGNIRLSNCSWNRQHGSH